MGAELTSPGPLPRMFLSSWVDRQRPRQGPRSEDSEPQQPPLRRKRPGCRGRHPGAVTVTLSLFTRAHTRTRAHTHISLCPIMMRPSRRPALANVHPLQQRAGDRGPGGGTRERNLRRARRNQPHALSEAQSTACALRSAINRMRSPPGRATPAARARRGRTDHRSLPLSPSRLPACLPPSLPAPLAPPPPSTARVPVRGRRAAGAPSLSLSHPLSLSPQDLPGSRHRTGPPRRRDASLGPDTGSLPLPLSLPPWVG